MIEASTDQTGPSQQMIPDPRAIGGRLRRRRQVRRVSLREVAALAGISTGLLSQIERGISMPSVRTLGAVCHALQMPVGWLFGEGGGDHGGVVVRSHQRRLLDLGAKGMRKELMTPDEITGIQMMRLVIRPGGSTGKTPYRHESGAKCGTVLSGTLGLEVDGQICEIAAGDAFAFPATALIRFWCMGEVETVALWVVAPAVY